LLLILFCAVSLRCKHLIQVIHLQTACQILCELITFLALDTRRFNNWV